MSIPMVFRWLWPVLVLLVSACSQDRLLTKQDYRQSQNDFMQGDTTEALFDFPRRTEQGDFITTMERGYLNLIQGKPDIKLMLQQADMLQNRVRYHVSREAKTFFYLQTPEDYYASEHEVIWLHFLLSWGYSLQGKYEDACVEAREAGSLLTLPWSPEPLRRSGHALVSGGTVDHVRRVAGSAGGFARGMVHGSQPHLGQETGGPRLAAGAFVCGAGRAGTGAGMGSGTCGQPLALRAPSRFQTPRTKKQHLSCR